MDTGDLLSEALNLMLLGMGTVFVFLCLLVLVTGQMSKLINRIAPPAVPTGMTEAAGGSSPSAALANDSTLLAVVTAAIHAHRSRRGE